MTMTKISYQWWAVDAAGLSGDSDRCAAAEENESCLLYVLVISCLLYVLLVIVDEKEEVRDELDMNCGGITPTSLGSDKFLMWMLCVILDTW